MPRGPVRVIPYYKEETGPIAGEGKNSSLK
jgi:hypothetical protein